MWKNQHPRLRALVAPEKEYSPTDDYMSSDRLRRRKLERAWFKQGVNPMAILSLRAQVQDRHQKTVRRVNHG